MKKPKKYTISGTIKIPQSIQIPNCHTWYGWYMFRLKGIGFQIKALQNEKSAIEKEMKFLRETYDKAIKPGGVISKWTWDKKK